MTTIVANSDLCRCDCGASATTKSGWAHGHWNRRPAARAAQSERVTAIWDDPARAAIMVDAQNVGKGAYAFRQAHSAKAYRQLAEGSLRPGNRRGAVQSKSERVKRTASLKARYADPAERAALVARRPGNAATAPELAVRAALDALGITHQDNAQAEGSPKVWDIVTSTHVIEVDGCYWHRCEEHNHKPANSSQLAVASRDALRPAQAAAANRSLLIIWEHTAQNSTCLAALLAQATA